MKRNLVGKKLLSLSLCLFAALSMVLLSACNSGPSAEEVIREGLSSEFDQIVNKKGDDWEDMVEEVGEDADLSEYGIDSAEFVNSLFDGFDYKIDSVDVDEDNNTAVAHVTITSKSMTEVMNAVQAAAGDLLKDESVYSLSEDELYKKVGEAMMEAINGVKARDVDVDLKLSCDDDGEWSEDDSVSSDVFNAIMK